MILPVGAKVDPVDDTIFCRMYAQAGLTSSHGIYIPQTAREEVFFAKVVSVGPGQLVDVDKDGREVRLPMNLKAGDSVIFARYHGERFQIGDGIWIIMRRADVLAKIDLGKSAGYFEEATVGKVDELSLDRAQALA
jgi:chaperonin GroES